MIEVDVDDEQEDEDFAPDQMEESGKEGGQWFVFVSPLGLTPDALFCVDVVCRGRTRGRDG